MALAEFAEGNKKFKNTFFKKNSKDLLELAEKGQSPKALFIGCSDSRVIPDLMIQTSPGDLFVIRNVGNLVPPYKLDEDFHATASGIEYAVNVLNVSDIIVCGHSHCGAINALYDCPTDKNLVQIKKWLELGTKAKSLAVSSLGANAPKEELLRLTEKLSIINQIDNLLSYPYIKERVKKGKLSIHGWYYCIKDGSIDYYDALENQFTPLENFSKN
ncbi:MAG: carbonic anhydrase [Helicobacteraceae bacterium]|nr:carbonic anhydrase [Helicobacteraceae bacterium]